MATIANIDSILNQIPNPEDLAWNHAMDISGAIHTRLKELGMTQRDLAEKLGVTPGRISQIIKGYPGMSLKLLARIESALDFRLDSGFRYEASVSGSSKSVSATMNPIYDKPRDDSHERRMGRRA
jgi:transcriptional regulator with XRE-family HTH domain